MFTNQSPTNHKYINELEQTADAYDQKILLNNYNASKPSGKCYMTPQSRTQAFINNFAKENNITKLSNNNDNSPQQGAQKTLNTLAEIKNQTREDTQLAAPLPTRQRDDSQSAATIRQISATFHISNNLKNLFDTKGNKKALAIHSKDNTINIVDDNANGSSNTNTQRNQKSSRWNQPQHQQNIENNYYFLDSNPGHRNVTGNSSNPTQRQDIIKSYDQIKLNQQQRQTSRYRANNPNGNSNNTFHQGQNAPNPNNNSGGATAFSLPKKLSNLNNANITFVNHAKNLKQQQQ